MASNRSRSNRSVGNKLNNLDSRVGKNEKGTNNPHLSPDVIEEAHLTDGAVAESKLADRAITETKIARGAVGTEHLGVVNAITADSGLTLKPGPDGGFIVIDGPEYVAPTPGSGELFALGFNELNQVVVSSSGIGGGDGAAAMPAGSIQPWPTRVAPEGWLVCDGAAVSRTTYSDLFNALVPTVDTGTFVSSTRFTLTTVNTVGSYNGLQIGDAVFFTTTGTLPTGISANTLYYINGGGTKNVDLATTRTITTTGYAVSTPVSITVGTGSGTHTMWHAPYGIGDGSTTFNVPDIRGRVVVGRDAFYTEFDAMGEKGGAKTHTLTASEIPAHAHTGTTDTDGSHRHWISSADYDDGNGTSTGSNNTQYYGLWADAGAYQNYDRDKGTGRYSSYAGSTHAHAFTTGTNGGSGGAHNNLQPYIALTYIIKHMFADGMEGPQGPQGEAGDAATVAVGSTTTGIPGSLATVTNAGTTSAAVLNFTIPRGETGVTGSTGPTGPSGTVAVGSTSTGAEGTDAAVTNSGTSTNAVLEFVIPRGNAASVAVGTTTTGLPDTDAEVTNSGDGSNAVFDFVIPAGHGATIDVGTTTTVTEDDAATVTNTGDNVDAIINFEIPRGKTGDSAGVQFAYVNDTADADPTNGKLKFNSTTPASITYLYIDNVDANAASMTAWYDQWDNSTSLHKGQIYVAEYRSDATAVFNVTGAVVPATGYYKVPVSYVSGVLPANNAVCYVSFLQAGDIGNETPYGGLDGQILSKASDTNYDFAWVYPTLASNVDVQLTGPILGGQALTYDDATSKWINATPATTLDSLTDVTLTEPLADGQALTYDIATDAWINATPATTLDSLTDVELTEPVTAGQALTYVPGATRTNLVPNPNFETDISGWYAIISNFLAQSSTYAFSGTKSLRQDLNETGDGVQTSPDITVTVGQTYTASAYVYVESTQSVSFQAGGSTSTASITGGAWTRMSTSFTASSTTANISISIPGVSGVSIYVDAVMLEQGSTLNEYFDGSTAGASWTGTAGASTSTLITEGVWANATPASTLADLTDVDLTTVPAENGDVLTYDAIAGEWIAQTLGEAALGAGAIMAWGGATAPSGWLMADGSAVSRTEYASLFAEIGTIFGTGDGTMTFNVPDLRGRTPFGYDSAQTEFDTIGETGGSKTTSFPTQGDGTSTGNGLTYSESMSSVDDGTYNNLPPYQTVNYIIKHAVGTTPADSALATRVSDLEEIVNTAYNQMPAGAIMAWGSASAPSNWITCDGSAVSRTLYASLYAAIGDSYGAGDGVTTFNLPNLKGRVPVGRDSANAAFDLLGETGGDQLLSKDGTGTATGYGLLYGESMDVADTTPTNMPPYQVVHYVIKATAGTTESDSALTNRVSTLEANIGSLIPAGTIITSALDTAPTGWMLCDGAAINRSTYASLFAAIGTSYGSGDGITTFNIPNLKGRTAFGKDSAQTQFDVLGETGGNKLIQGHGSGTATGYGLTYSESVLTATGLTDAQNLPPYTVLNYMIRLFSEAPDAESEFVTRLGEVETFLNNGGNDSPAGSIMQWAASAPPTNWLVCDGSSVLRSAYPSLFEAIGVQYGAADSTHFNLPNLKGRVAVGRDASQTEFDTLGETGGAKTHTLTQAEIPSHTHTGTTSSSGSHTHTVTIGGGAHTHALPLGQQAAANANDIAYRSGTSNGYDGSFRTGFEATGSGYNASLSTHTHTTSVSTDGAHTHTFTTASAGSDGAHNNLQPYIVLNYIIKATSGMSTADSALVAQINTINSTIRNIPSPFLLMGA